MSATLFDRDDLVPMARAPKRIPGRPHRSTIHRWMKDGILLPDGTRAHLKGHRVGRRIFIAPEDLDAFVEKLRKIDEAPPCRRTHGAKSDKPHRNRRAEQAQREAGEIGI